MIYAYQDAVDYVARYLGKWELDYQQLIQALARAKGLRSRIDKNEVQEFFCPVPLENKFPDLPKVRWEDILV